MFCLIRTSTIHINIRNMGTIPVSSWMKYLSTLVDHFRAFRFIMVSVSTLYSRSDELERTQKKAVMTLLRYHPATWLEELMETITNLGQDSSHPVQGSNTNTNLEYYRYTRLYSSEFLELWSWTLHFSTVLCFVIVSQTLLGFSFRFMLDLWNAIPVYLSYSNKGFLHSHTEQ
jgi:hypothetical protein